MTEKHLLKLGNVLVQYDFLYKQTASYFEDYLIDQKACPDIKIALKAEELEEYRWLVVQNERSRPFLEFQSLMVATGNRLLFYKHALFHGVALLWKGKAWIFTAPSGTGKTTQLRHWRDLLKKDVKTINGDKPILECRDDGTVWVHSSPWRGKEKYGISGMSAPLGGIVLLEQSADNHITKLNKNEAILPLFRAFVSYPETTDQIKGQAFVLQQMLEAAPVWKLQNKGDPDSAELTIEVLSDWLVKRQ